MRIAFSGTANTGKTTLIKNFLGVWSSYKTTDKTYRDVLVEQDLQHSSTTTPETQTAILNFMVDQLQATSKSDKIIFDRCPLDNLVYTLWAHEKGIEGFDKKYVDKTIQIVKESMRHLDIIFLLKYDPQIIIENDGVRDTDINYIQEIDNLFGALFDQYEQNYDADIFFPKNDSPGIIVLPTGQQQRINLISEYLDTDGNIYGDEHSILNPSKLDELEALLKQQQSALEKEEHERELYKKFGLL